MSLCFFFNLRFFKNMIMTSQKCWTDEGGVLRYGNGGGVMEPASHGEVRRCVDKEGKGKGNREVSVGREVGRSTWEGDKVRANALEQKRVNQLN